MKLLVALAFLAVASAVPRPGVQPIRLPAPAAPEVIESDNFAPNAVKVVDAPLEDAQDPASYFQYAPVDAVNVIDSVDDQARQFVMSMIDISPMYVSEDVLRAVREAAEKIQSVQLPEPFAPETFEETVDAVKIADGPVSDASELTFEPVNVVDGPINEEVESVNAESLSFEPVAVEANNDVFDGSVDAVNVVDAPVDALNFVDVPISELSFEPVALEANNEEVFEGSVDAVNVVDAPISELSFEPVPVEANNEVYETPVDAVRVVDIAEESFQKIAPSELKSIRIAPWQVEDVPQDFIPQLHLPIRYPNPLWR